MRRSWQVARKAARGSRVTALTRRPLHACMSVHVRARMHAHLRKTRKLASPALCPALLLINSDELNSCTQHAKSC